MVVECVSERKGLVVTHQCCPDRPYLELQVPEEAGVVEFVECMFMGRDQGWYSGGVPEVSYTWVDATIERPPGRNVLGSFGVDNNRPGSQVFELHKRRWDVRSKKAQRVWYDLRPGDVVQMIPRARYPGWACLVQEARIKVGYRPVQKAVQPLEDTVAPSPRSLPLPIYSSRLDSENHNVRILLVEPALSHGDPIVCSLLTTQLSSGQQFDALSYYWGTGNSKKLLTINGHDLLFSSSVVAALRRLRRQEQQLAIWIDQICINQPDVDEREEQVRLMSEIYSSAKSVHVWLGEGDMATWTALHIVRDLFNMNHHVCPGGAACQCSGTQHALDVAAFNSHPNRSNKPPSLASMEAVFFAHVKNEHGELADAAGAVNNLQFTTLMSTLFINPWFRRVWVLQEALLANDAIVHCGEERVPWREVLQTSDWLATIPAPLYSVPHITMPHIWSLLRQGDGEQVEELELLDVFMRGLEMRATDARDKLFALLSFAKRTGRGTNVPSAIRSSYKKRAEQVFADFTLWWIREHRSLSILSCVHSHRDRTWQRLQCDSEKPPQLQSPTWAIGHEGQARWGWLTLDATFNFRASANAIPDEELLDQALSEPGLRLRLKGFEMATIKEILRLSLTQYRKPLIKPARELLQVFNALFDSCGHRGTWNSKLKGLDRAKSPGPIPVDKLREEMSDHVRTHSHWEQQQEHQLAMPLPRHVSEDLVADTQVQVETTNTGLPTCLDPFLFEAENGAIGICPWMAEKGDVIVILHGGKVPYLLRPAASTAAGTRERLFRFIGECYVMGAVDGMWFRGQVEKGIDPQTFTLI